MITLASLGLSCQTAYQLARYGAANPDSSIFAKGPLDWIISSPEKVAEWLDAGLPIFEPGEISVRGRHAFWDRFDFWFWHGFRSHEGLLQVEQNFVREQQKFIYQTLRLRSIDPQRTIFFLSNTQDNLAYAVFDPGEEAHYHIFDAPLYRLAESLKRFYGVSVPIHGVTRRDRATESLLRNRSISVINPTTQEWTGDVGAWQSIIHSQVSKAQPMTASALHTSTQTKKI